MTRYAYGKEPKVFPRLERFELKVMEAGAEGGWRCIPTIHFEGRRPEIVMPFRLDPFALPVFSTSELAEEFGVILIWRSIDRMRTPEGLPICALA